MTSTASGEQFRALRGAEQQDLVTGEAVLLDIPAASLPQRLVSGLIDLVLGYVGFWLTLWMLAQVLTGAPEVSIVTIMLVVTVFWFVGVPVAIQTATRGRSVGRWVMRLRTVREDGGPIVFRHALVRGLIGYVELYALSGIPALLAGISTTRSRRLGDLAAGTYVVREATHIRLQAPAQMPYALAGWAQRADLAPMPDGVALAIRQLLERQWTLTPAARATLTQDLLARVLPLVSPPPPTGAPGDQVLAAVLAERRRRDEVRLHTEAGLRHRLLPTDQL